MFLSNQGGHAVDLNASLYFYYCRHFSDRLSMSSALWVGHFHIAENSLQIY